MMLSYSIVALLFLILGIYIGNKKTRDKVNSGVRKLLDKMKQRRARSKERR